MPRPKGSPKYGGRKLGTPNKNPSELRKLMQDFCLDHFGDYVKAMSLLRDTKPDAYAREFGQALRLCIPALQSIEAKIDGDVTEQQKTIEKKLSDLAASITTK